MAANCDHGDASEWVGADRPRQDRPDDANPPERRRRAALARLGGGALSLMLAGAIGNLARAGDGPDPLILPAWNATAFAARNVTEVLAALGLDLAPQQDSRVTLVAPAIAETGAVVPIEVRSALPGTRRIALLVLRNPNTLAADFRPGKRLAPHLATRLKLAETTEVLALVEADEGLFLARQLVKVTLGGCGG